MGLTSSETNSDGVYAGFKKVYENLAPEQQAQLLQQLGVTQ
jgi:hypothetical protein